MRSTTFFAFLSVCVLFSASSYAAKLVLDNEPINPIPQDVSVDRPLADLGKALFHDPQLSGDNSISCASCHPIHQGGVDGKQFSTGINQSVLGINTPTVINAYFNFVQFWDGRAKNLVEQVSFPIMAPDEMGSSWEQVIGKLSSNARYPSQFTAVFGDASMTPERISQAIGEYQKSLLSPNSRFDQFLMGNENAITENELKGYLLFKNYGCVSCHQGRNVGGNMFEKMGLIRDYFADHGPIKKADLGRFNVTGDEKHKHFFKVPSLRNIERTAPYFHDGSAATLTDAINIMAKYQLGRRLPNSDVALIIDFLKTLTGEVSE